MQKVPLPRCGGCSVSVSLGKMHLICLSLLILLLNVSLVVSFSFAPSIIIHRGRIVLRSTVSDHPRNFAETTICKDNTSIREAEAKQFHEDLESIGMGKCLGIFHSVGCRNLADVQQLTASQIDAMGVGEALSSSNIQDETSLVSTNNISTELDVGVFTNDVVHDFQFEAICETNEIYKGRLFTPEQCNVLARASEFHAYNLNPSWHGMACKSIDHESYVQANRILDRLLNHESGLHSVYPDMTKGSLRFESDSEPHLVKYSGERLEAPLHKDNTHKSLTLNALLSDTDDFGGGGTYIQVIDKVIKLEQGEMLIHPGNLEHAGAEITFGVRRLMVAFLECEWDSL